MTFSRDEGTTLPVPVDTSASSKKVAHVIKIPSMNATTHTTRNGQGIPTFLEGELTGNGGGFIFIPPPIFRPPPPPPPPLPTPDFAPAPARWTETTGFCAAGAAPVAEDTVT